MLADVIGTATGGARANNLSANMSREVKEEQVMMEIDAAAAAEDARATNLDETGPDESMEVDDQDDVTGGNGNDNGEDEPSDEDADQAPDDEPEDEDDGEDEDERNGRRRKPDFANGDEGRQPNGGADDAEDEEEVENEAVQEAADSDREQEREDASAKDEADADNGDEAAEEVEADHEVENEIQPTQRAEALDILAAMELKFAILRQRIYLDKMRETAREEKMLIEGELCFVLDLARQYLSGT